ncbi:hypothetical protein D3C75_822540 [compost metagenome]
MAGCLYLYGIRITGLPFQRICTAAGSIFQGRLQCFTLPYTQFTVTGIHYNPGGEVRLRIPYRSKFIDFQGYNLHIAALGIETHPPAGRVRENNIREHGLPVIHKHLYRRFIHQNAQLDPAILR